VSATIPIAQTFWFGPSGKYYVILFAVVASKPRKRSGNYVTDLPARHFGNFVFYLKILY
jgi:hypothetical protein